MKVTNRFTIEQHEGPYASWPKGSFLFDGLHKTETLLPGYSIILSFELQDGRYLLFLDYDCPYEEVTTVVLLSSDLKILCKKELPWFHDLNGNFKILDENTVSVDTYEDDTYKISVRDKKFFWQSPIKVSSV